MPDPIPGGGSAGAASGNQPQPFGGGVLAAGAVCPICQTGGAPPSWPGTRPSCHGTTREPREFSVLFSASGQTSAMGDSPLGLSYSVNLSALPRDAVILAISTRYTFTGQTPQAATAIDNGGAGGASNPTGGGATVIIWWSENAIETIQNGVSVGSFVMTVTAQGFFNGPGTMVGPVGGFNVRYRTALWG